MVALFQNVGPQLGPNPTQLHHHAIQGHAICYRMIGELIPSCEDTSRHIALKIKQKDTLSLMGWPVHNLQNPDSHADGKSEEWCSQKKQETYAAADQDISEHLEENSKLNINDENSSHSEVDVTCIDDEISKNKSPTMKNGQKKQKTYAMPDQEISEHLEENSKLNINDENSSHNEVDVTCIDGEISKNKSPTMKNGQKKQETYAAADQEISEHLEENSKLNINDENSSHNEVHVTCIDGEISNKSPTMKNNVTHNAIKPYMCQTCGEEFGVFERLKIHIDTHFGIERHMCEACGEELGTFNALRRHVEAHAGIKKHECGTCGKKYGRSNTLKTHIARNGHKHKNKCLICSKAFRRSSELKKHMTTHTIKTALKPHEMMNSDEEEFDRFEKLKSHVEERAGCKKHKCRICGKKTSTAYNLEVHMTTHTGRKKHKCGICGKKTSTAYNLEVHMTTHTGRKKHKCGTCGLKFSGSYHLNNHMLTHTGLEEHKCMICSKAFGRPDHLKRHMKTHEL